jgi:hypothetical protein
VEGKRTKNLENLPEKLENLPEKLIRNRLENCLEKLENLPESKFYFILFQTFINKNNLINVLAFIFYFYIIL